VSNLSVADIADRRTRPKLLVVPHVCARDVSVREVELARRLTQQFNVHCLWWDDALHIDGQPSISRRWKQFMTATRSAFASPRVELNSDTITYLHAPILQPLLLQKIIGRRQALRFARQSNAVQLQRVVAAHGITHILLSALTFGVSGISGADTFIDLVDWIPEENLPPEEIEALRDHLRRAATNLQGFFTVSEPLAEKLHDECAIKAVPVPNGADLHTLRAVPPGRIAALRQRFGLQDRYVIGYIVNHGSFTGVDFVVKVFEQVRQRMPDAALLIVGPAEYWRPLLEAWRDRGVVWVGPVETAEVSTYFHAIDIGVLAQEKSKGTEYAFQIKNVEYTACRKFVVSTPLLTWERLRWPNILLTDLKIDNWVDAICRARNMCWSPAWDTLTNAYDWTALATRMATVMLGFDHQRGQQACAS